MVDAAVGFRVHSGWATAVLLLGTAAAPEVADSRVVQLADPSVPDSRQPYHAGLDLPKGEAARTVALLVKSVERFARRALLDLFMAYRVGGYRLRAAGVVVGSNVDPATIENEHVRADAAEGQLFRVVIQETAQSRGLALSVTATVEEEIFDTASKKLGIPERRLKEMVSGFGRRVDGPWRAEEKAAALAAWVGLLRRR
jgi:hypothetical protein